MTRRSTLNTRERVSVKCLCPSCGVIVELGQDCDMCGRVIVRNGVADFVGADEHSAEINFYNTVYSARARRIPPPETMRHHWEGDPDSPQNGLILKALGDLAGQIVLLIGNGASDKEIFFLTLSPSTLIYSDLSCKAIEQLKMSSSSPRLELAAIDAMKIPFPDDSLDVVYGYAMVHHLPDSRKFIKEATRVLKPGGRAVFYDDAYSPLWHTLKTSWLASLRRKSHQRSGISPEDLKFSEKGGFHETDLALLIQEAGAIPWFKRCSLIQYLLHRGAGKLLCPSFGDQIRHGKLARICCAVDTFLAGRSQWYAKNQVRLVWGFTKRQPEV